MKHQTILSRDESQLIVVKLLFSVQHSGKYASRLQAALCLGLHANSSEKVWAQSIYFAPKNHLQSGYQSYATVK